METDSKLEEILDNLVESYQSDDEINNLDTYVLPNRRAIIEAFSHVQHLLLLGYFSTRRLDEQSLRLALGEHLLPAREILCGQVQRAARWEDRNKPVEERRKDGWCRKNVHEFLERLPELRTLLRGDITAAFESDPAAESVEDVVFSYPGIFAITAYRSAHILFKQGVPMIPRIITEHAHMRTGIDIHPGARIGNNFFIDHGTGVVIGATSDIGDNVKLYQGVTLGSLSVKSDVPRGRDQAVKRHPTLEDGVTVYAGSTILGGDTVVGARSVVGGNVWLTKSVPPDSKIFYRPNGNTETK